MKRFLPVFFSIVGLAQQPEEFKLLATLNTPIKVASFEALPARETPGIVTVIDRANIVAWGAKDLIDVLQYIPGFEFASDTNGVVGIGVRTNWGHDGKVLLIIDGLEMTEPLYGTNQFGHHYPLDNVQRIEIIRGPGSVLYGGFAELAVINVITDSGITNPGVSGDFWLSHESSIFKPTGSVFYGYSQNGYTFSIAYTKGSDLRGTGTWQTPKESYYVGRDSGIYQDFLNVKFSVDDLNFQFIRDRYVISDYTKEFKPLTLDLQFPAEFFGIDYKFSLGDWTIKPKFSIKSQLPWTYTFSRTDRNTRTVGGILGNWTNGSFKVDLGVEDSQDNTSIFWSSRSVRESYVYKNRAALAGVGWISDFGNIDFSLRYDKNSEFASATSPRLAFTKATETWHFKALAAGAFGAPSIEDLFANPNLKPERTTTYELEYGHKLGEDSYLSGNLYSLRILRPIAYGNPSYGVNGYYNFDSTGSDGLELTLKTINNNFIWFNSASVARPEDKNAPFYLAPDHHHVGFANFKASSRIQYPFGSGWSFNPSVLFLGAGHQYGYRMGDTKPTEFNSVILVDFVISKKISKSFDFNFICTNALNAKNLYIQAYGTPGVGGNPPMPGPSRELCAHLAFHF